MLRLRPVSCFSSLAQHFRRTWPRRCIVFGLLSLALATVLRLSAQDATMLRNDADRVRLEAFRLSVERDLAFIPGEVLVRFRAGIDSSRQLSALSVLRQGRLTKGTWVGGSLHLTGLDEADSEHAAFLLRQQPEVADARPNYLRRLRAVPNDPLYSLQWNMNEINMPVAWDINRSAGRGVTVAVLDSGLTTFQGNMAMRFPDTPTFRTFTIPFLRPPDFNFDQVDPGAEFSATGPWSFAGRPVLFDTDGHGTHVAGTIAQQTNNSFGFAGVANGVTVLPVKICSGELDVFMAWGRDLRFPGPVDGCADSDIIRGIHHAVDSGAKVLNLSIGGPGPSPFLLDALNYAVSRGAFVAIAAGNSGDEGNVPEYPAAYGAVVDGVVAVAATTPRRTRAGYSNFGSYVELAAPGGGGQAGCAVAEDLVWQVAPISIEEQPFPPRFDLYFPTPICGTSMAAPHVAGAAALLISQGVTSPAAVEAALERFAVDLGTAGRDVDFGHGLIDVRATLRGMGFVK